VINGVDLLVVARHLQFSITPLVVFITACTVFASWAIIPHSSVSNYID